MWGYHAKCESERLQNKEVFTFLVCIYGTLVKIYKYAYVSYLHTTTSINSVKLVNGLAYYAWIKMIQQIGNHG